MIKHINANEILTLKRRLKHIDEIKQVLNKRNYKSKLDIATKLLNMKILNNKEVETFMKNKKTFIIKDYQKNGDLYNNLTLIKEFKNKVSISIVKDFNSLSLSFDKAIEAYLTLNSFTLIKEVNLNDELLKYFNKYNVLNENILSDIKALTFRYVEDYSDEEYEERLERYFEDLYPPDTMDSILESVCEMMNIKFEKELYYDIIFNPEVIDPCYKELTESCVALANEYSGYDNRYDEFINSFGENPYVYCFKGVDISEYLKEAINSKVRSYDNGGFLSEIFSMGDNTYLTISENLFLEILDENFLLLIICFLLGEGGK